MATPSKALHGAVLVAKLHWTTLSWARREKLAPDALLAGTSVGAVRGHQQRIE
jgi:hypothetical protein